MKPRIKINESDDTAIKETLKTFTMGHELDNVCIRTIKEALSRQIPRLPNLDGDGYAEGKLVYDTWECPCCGKKFDIYDEYAKYCQNCGQKIDTTEMDR